MARAIAETNQPVAVDAAELANRTDEVTSRLVGGTNRLLERAGRSAQRVKEAAQGLRMSTALQHAAAARERGNFEAAFWLYNEEFNSCSDDESVAVPLWDIALLLDRVGIASSAGVKLVEIRAAAGEPELAAQYWLELVKEAPDALVSPVAIASILPALKARLARSSDDGPDDRSALAGYLHRAVQHAVDPRNTGLHPGVALRIFEEGREINPQASRRAAESALESPYLHEAKRERLSEWLGGTIDEVPPPETNAPQEPATREPRAAETKSNGLSEEEIAKAAARLRRSIPAPRVPVEINAPTKLCVERGILIRIEDDALVVQGAPNGRLLYHDIQAVAVAGIMGLADQAVTVIDLISNWTRRYDEPLEIVRLQLNDLDLGSLVTRKRSLCSDFATLMSDIMERTNAVPLPDPESALGTRITCYRSQELYERVGLRVPDRGAA